MEKKTIIIENPTSDEQLPEKIRKEISEMLKAGWAREHLLISESGAVMIDTEACDHERLMRTMHPERPRDEYMYVTYPERIVLQE